MALRAGAPFRRSTSRHAGNTHPQRRLPLIEGPTRPMRAKAAQAGFYTSSDGNRYPNVEPVTAGGLLQGTERLQRPSTPAR